MRRAANRSGVYSRYEFTFPASMLKAGPNKVSLQMPVRERDAQTGPDLQRTGSTANNGIMYDTIVLETD